MQRFILSALAALSTTALFGEFDNQRYNLFLQEYAYQESNEVPEAILESLLHKMNEEDMKAHPELKYYKQKLLCQHECKRKTASLEEFINKDKTLLKKYIQIYKEIAAVETSPLNAFAQYKMEVLPCLLNCYHQTFTTKEEFIATLIKNGKAAREAYLRKQFNIPSKENNLYNEIAKRISFF